MQKQNGFAIFITIFLKKMMLAMMREHAIMLLNGGGESNKDYVPITTVFPRK